MNDIKQPLGAEAKIRYGDGEFVVERQGTHVFCAVSNEPILLPLLRYWSVERQEAYKDAVTALKAHKR